MKSKILKKKNTKKVLLGDITPLSTKIDQKWSNSIIIMDVHAFKKNPTGEQAHYYNFQNPKKISKCQN